MYIGFFIGVGEAALVSFGVDDIPIEPGSQS